MKGPDLDAGENAVQLAHLGDRRADRGASIEPIATVLPGQRRPQAAPPFWGPSHRHIFSPPSPMPVQKGKPSLLLRRVSMRTRKEQDPKKERKGSLVEQARLAENAGVGDMVG